MYCKFAFLSALLAAACARPQSLYSPTGLSTQSETPAVYDFYWSVQDANSGNNFGQNESRNGENTFGSYYVLLPDGRIQRVSYRVNGDSGFIAEVSYEGEARYDNHNHKQIYNS